MSNLGKRIVLTVPAGRDGEACLRLVRGVLEECYHRPEAGLMADSARLVDLEAMYNGAVMDRRITTPEAVGFCRAVRQLSELAGVAQDAQPQPPA